MFAACRSGFHQASATNRPLPHPESLEIVATELYLDSIPVLIRYDYTTPHVDNDWHENPTVTPVLRLTCSCLSLIYCIPPSPIFALSLLFMQQPLELRSHAAQTRRFRFARVFSCWACAMLMVNTFLFEEACARRSVSCLSVCLLC